MLTFHGTLYFQRETTRKFFLKNKNSFELHFQYLRRKKHQPFF